MSSSGRRAAAVAAKEANLSFFEALYAARDADAQEIADGIHLGAFKATSDRQAMKKRRISHVLIAHPVLPEQHPKDFKYGRAPLMDEPTANLLELLPDALDFLGGARTAGGRVFVCCAKGISRSSSIVISLLMFERNIGFEEAFRICEEKRPIVYPNIGFQQQLRHLETLLKASDAEAPWNERVKRLRKAVPTGDLEAPRSPLRIRGLIGDSMGGVLEEVEALAAKVCSQPQLLQKRELWKRHGLFFENLHKYKALPADPGLLERARSASTTLKSLPKIFSDTLKGVKLALAVAKELDDWATFAAPVLTNPLLTPLAGTQRAGGGATAAASEREEEEDPMRGYVDTEDLCRKGDAKKDKKAKKAEKEAKKQSKADKKAAKAAKKAEKIAAKIEKAARRAELAADSSKQRAEEAARRAEETAREIAQLEDEEVFEARAAAARRRAGTSPPRRRAPSPSSDESDDGRGGDGGGSSSDADASPPSPKRPRHHRG